MRRSDLTFAKNVWKLCGAWTIGEPKQKPSCAVLGRDDSGTVVALLGFYRGHGELGQFWRIYFGNMLVERWDVKKRQESSRFLD